MLRHLRPVAGHSAVPERVQGVAKDIFHCCVAFAFDAAGPALDQRDLNRRLPEQIGFWMHGFEIAADRGRFIYDRAVVEDQRWHCASRIDRRSEEHTSELQSLMRISYAVFCLKKKKHNHI